MAQGVTVRPYPYESLDRVPRELVGVLGHLRFALLDAAERDAIVARLGELLGNDATVRVLSVRAELGDSAFPPSISVRLGTLDARLRLRVDCEIELAAKLIARAVGRNFAVANSAAAEETGQALSGALAAVLSHLARRGRPSAPPLIPLAALPELDGHPMAPVLVVHLMCGIGQLSYLLRVVVDEASILPVVSSTPASRTLFRLGDLPLSVPLVLGCSLALPREVSSLSTGDVWMPGDGLRVRVEGAGLSGQAFLTPRNSETGMGLELAPGRAVVLAEQKHLPLTPPEAPVSESNDPLRNERLDTILETPVVVRVELGQISMSAREWSTLGAGDVLPLGRKVGDAAILRVGGVEVARGDLVDIEGELGVRIRQR